MEKLGINEALRKVCNQLCINEPTPIQCQLIPLILQKKDVIGVSPTGSGKTVCYTLPTLQLLTQDPYGVFSLFFLPTKELALQVYEQVQTFSVPYNYKNDIQLIIGGSNLLTQLQLLSRRPYIVIATPGRFLKLLTQSNSEHVQYFNRVSIVVFDEADYLLSGTLLDEMKSICSLIGNPAQQQYIFVTATMTASLKNHCDILKYQYQNENENAKHQKETLHKNQHLTHIVDLTPIHQPPIQQMQHLYLHIPSSVKLAYLVYLLETTYSKKSCIVFTKTCQTAQLVNATLELLNFSTTTLHSLLNLPRRIAHLEKFRGHLALILVGTDVLSRGIDIPKVHAVINYDFPNTFENYIHRAGRTARIGRQGLVVSFITEKENVQQILKIEQSLHTKLQLLEVNENDVMKRLTEVTKKHQEAKQILYEANFFEHAAEKKQKKLQKLENFS